MDFAVPVLAFGGVWFLFMQVLGSGVYFLFGCRVSGLGGKALGLRLRIRVWVLGLGCMGCSIVWISRCFGVMGFGYWV